MTDARKMEFDSTGTGMNTKAKAAAREGEHLVRRAVTVGQDQILHLGDDEDLRVYSNEFSVVKSHGDYHCTCGEVLDGIDEAEAHLQEVRNDGS